MGNQSTTVTLSTEAPPPAPAPAPATGAASAEGDPVIAAAHAMDVGRLGAVTAHRLAVAREISNPDKSRTRLISSFSAPIALGKGTFFFESLVIGDKTLKDVTLVQSIGNGSGDDFLYFGGGKKGQLSWIDLPREAKAAMGYKQR